MEIVIAAGDLASATKTGGVLLSETFNIPYEGTFECTVRRYKVPSYLGTYYLRKSYYLHNNTLVRIPYLRTFVLNNNVWLPCLFNRHRGMKID